MNTTSKQTGFDECVGVTRFFMKAIGLWPLDDPKSLKTRCKILLLGVSMLFFNIVPQMTQAVQASNDFNLVLEVLTTAAIIQVIAFIKLLGIRCNAIGLKKVVIEVSRDLNNTTNEEQKVMWSNAKLSKWAAILCYSSSTGSAITYSFVFLMTTATAYRNSTIDKSLFLRASFPFDTSYTPIYEILCFGQSFAAILCCVVFSSFDGFFVLSILHFSGQLHNLKHRFRNLVMKHNMDKIGFIQSLSLAMLKHQRLISHTDIIENSFNKAFLLQVIGASVALYLQGYQFVMIISESNTKLLVSLIFIVVFTIGNTASLFMYCYIAQIIRDESVDMFHAIYEMRWYELSAKDAALLVM